MLPSLLALPVETDSVDPVPVPLTLIVSVPASPDTLVLTPSAVLSTSMSLLPWLASRLGFQRAEAAVGQAAEEAGLVTVVPVTV